MRDVRWPTQRSPHDGSMQKCHHLPRWVPDIRSWVLTRHDGMRSSSVVYHILYRFFATLARLAVRSGRSKDASTCHQIDPIRRPRQGVPKRSLTSHDRVSGTHRLRPHPNRPSRLRRRGSLTSSGRPAATDSSTSTGTPHDQARHHFRQPQAQVTVERCGAGSIACCWRILQIVDAPILWPSPVSDRSTPRCRSHRIMPGQHAATEYWAPPPSIYQRNCAHEDHLGREPEANERRDTGRRRITPARHDLPSIRQCNNSASVTSLSPR
jgi:hypothetical protein